MAPPVTTITLSRDLKSIPSEMLTDKDFEIFPCHFIQDSNIRAGLDGFVKLALLNGAPNLTCF